MKPNTFKQLMQGATLQAGTISAIVHSRQAEATVDPVELESNLTAGGFTVTYLDKPNGAWARVYDADGVLRAQGYSSSREDALLHAAFGAVREEVAAQAVGQALEAARLEVMPELRQKLESRYILEGGPAVLVRDIGNMIAIREQAILEQAAQDQAKP